jgi:glycosyltransferase involved in cell wall biosynthesis
MKKMHIAFIRPQQWPAANKRVAKALQNQFPEASFEIIDVITDLKNQPFFMSRNAIEVLRMYGAGLLAHRYKLRTSFSRTPYFYNYVQKWLKNKLDKGKYTFTFQMQSLFDASQPGIPHFVYTDHTHLANLLYPTFDQRNLFSEDWISLERKIYQKASILFTRSSHVTSSLLHQYHTSPDKLKCVYYGANIVTHNNLDSVRFQHKNILFVGIDWERKGGPDLLKAFEIVQQAHPDATLTIVGCTPEVSISNVAVVGKIPLEEVGYYYEKASIFCLPTTNEPAGVVFIEAMSYHIPLVGTNIGAVPDFITQGCNGYMVNVGDPQALAESLIRLLDDPARCQTMGEAGYQLTISRYNWDTVAANMKETILNFIV